MTTDSKTEQVHFMASRGEVAAMSGWAKAKGIRTRSQGIRRLVKAAMAIDDGYPRLREAERLVQALRDHVRAAVKIRVDGGDPAEMDRLLAALLKHYPDIERKADDLSGLLREIGDELKAEDSTRG